MTGWKTQLNALRDEIGRVKENEMNMMMKQNNKSDLYLSTYHSLYMIDSIDHSIKGKSTLLAVDRIGDTK